MDRRTFLSSIALLSAAPIINKSGHMNLLNQLVNTLPDTEKMPVVFAGHGNPMNAIEENEFVKGWRQLALELPKVSAVLCISAHWETTGTFVTAMDKPQTIHDFGGFPKALFDVQYPAPGMKELAEKTKEHIKSTTVELSNDWGLDHGCWSVLKRIYPNADIPVVQLSLDYTKDPQYHYDLAKQLAALRKKGVLILGSGNMVHNLGAIAWDKMNEIGYGYDWAIEANTKMKELIMKGDHASLINYSKQGKPFTLSIPTPEHYLPLLYTLALKEENDAVKFFNDKLLAGSLAMTSVRIG